MSALTSTAFAATAADSQASSQVAIVYHRAGSAVLERLDASSRVARLLRPAFRPRLPILLHAWLAFWRFLVGKLTLHHLFVLDTVVPHDGSGSRLDQLVRQLGYDIDARRQLHGSRAQIARRLVVSLFAGLILPAFRLLPDYSQHPWLQDIPFLHWASHLPVDPLHLLLVGLGVAVVLFIVLEWQFNLLGLLHAQPDVSNPEAETAFIADQVRQSQRRGWPWLFLELPLVFLLVPVLLLLHAGLLLAWLVRPRRRTAGLPLYHIAWVLADGLILGAILLGARLDRDDAGRPIWSSDVFNVWGALLLGSVVFLAVSTVRELGKVLRPRHLPLEARDSRKLLLVGCLAALGCLALAAFPQLSRFGEVHPWALSVLSSWMLLAATALLALVRLCTQSLRLVLLRVAEAQRLGNDLEALCGKLTEVVPARLFVVALWNTDEAPQRPVGHRVFYDPDDCHDEVLADLRRLLRPRFHIRLDDDTLNTLTRYLLAVSRRLRAPYTRWKERLHSRAQGNSELLRLLYQVLAPLAADRARFHDPKAGPSGGWQQGFQDLEERLEHEVSLKHLSPARQQQKRAQLAQLLGLFRDWEAETARTHLEVLEQHKAARFPGYTEALVRLALFVDRDAEDKLNLESQRAGREGLCAENRTAKGVPRSLCRDAGLLPAALAEPLTDDYQREGFLTSVDPVIFHPAWLSFLAGSYLPAPLLLAEHEAVLRHFTQLGRTDHRYLKVAAAWLASLCRAEHDTVLRGRPRRPGEPALLPVFRLRAWSVRLLLDYFEAVSSSGLPGVGVRELEEELDRLSGARSPGVIPAALADLAADLDELPTEEERKQSERLLGNLREQWRRMQIRQEFIRGNFDPASGPRLEQLFAASHGAPAPGGYDAGAVQDHYLRGQLALERGQPLEALAHLDVATRDSAEHDELQHAKARYQACRALAVMGLDVWAAEFLARLHTSYAVSLRDEPLLFVIHLDKAVADAHRYALQAPFAAKVHTRWLEPALEQAAEPGFPANLRAQLDLVLALCEEKRAADPARARALAESARARLQTVPMRRWQDLQITVHLARLARRYQSARVADLLDADLQERLASISPLGDLEVCHTLARDHQAQGQLRDARRWWCRMIEVGLHPDRALAARPGAAGAGWLAADGLGLELLLSEVTPRPGQYVSWAKVLDAILGLSDQLIEEAAGHEISQLARPDREVVGHHWAQASRLLSLAHRAVRRFLREAEKVSMLPGRADPPPTREGGLLFLGERLAGTPSGTLTLADAYRDLTYSDGGQRRRDRPAPALLRLEQQMKHAHDRVHLMLAFLLPCQVDGARTPALLWEETLGAAHPLEEGDLVRGTGQAASLAVPFSVPRYLASLEEPALARAWSFNSATLRCMAECCRLILLHALEQNEAPGPRALLHAWRQRAQGLHPGPLWESAGHEERLRLLAVGLLEALTPDFAPEAEVQTLRALAEQLSSAGEQSLLHAESLEHDFLRCLARLQAFRPDVRCLVFAAPARRLITAVLARYELVLSALFERPENDVYEGVLNRVTILEALRDLGWLLSDRKRQLFATLRANLDRVDQLFLDLDRLNNPTLAGWVRHRFFPHRDDVRRSLQEIQEGVRHLQQLLESEEEPAEAAPRGPCAGLAYNEAP
jgi:hypothetical protein